ncbi:MAG TPA: hypothetical protein VMF90_20690 [Rhizobiaceae bacterium]|nr:hypothetical protein [Rhizobiaceae bacterium]
MPVNWSAVIEGNHGVLKRVLSELIAMAAPREGAPTLPRPLHTAILRILRPAEAAARRLIVVMARGIVVTLPAFRPRTPKKTSLARKGGAGIILPRGFVMKRGVIMPSPPPVSRRIPSLPLFDPRKRFFYVRPAPGRGVPRISDPGAGARLPIPVRQPPLPDGRVHAARIHQRLATLAAALDDLPAQARRYARLRALRLAARAREREREATGAPNPHHKHRSLHVWPLRPGHPPGWQRRPKHEVDEVLKDLQYFAREVLEQPDTS